MSTALRPLLDLAVETAHSAGALARRLHDESAVAVAATKSSPTDVVTESDRAAERLIHEAITSARPHDAFLGEEGASSGGSTGVRWIVDPIDGTVNYLYGIPAWAVSIAAEVDDEVRVGVVHNPVLGETWTAVRDDGARLHDRLGERVVRVSAEHTAAGALVGTGFGYDADLRARQGAAVAALLPHVRDIRRMGSAALDLCALAAGRLDAYVEHGLQPWDRAAGELIAAEAGATVAGLRGRPAGTDLVVAASPDLFDVLEPLLERAGFGALAQV